MDTPFQEFLTKETLKEIDRIKNGGYGPQAWVIQCDGVTIPMDPTPTETGAKARIKAHFFRRTRYGFEDDPNDYRKSTQHFPHMSGEEMEKEFKKWFKDHCKAVNLL